MNSNIDLERLYHPDGKSLGSLVSGLSGSGKTTAVISTLQQANWSHTFGPDHRFIVIDPKTQKGDYDVLSEPVLSASDATESILKERMTVLWPDVDTVEDEVSHLIDFIFNLSDSDEKVSFTLIIDEASILITPTRIPAAIKRLSVQGRAKRIKPVFISQRPIVNRWTDANMSNVLMFRTLPVDADTLSRRWGIDFEKAEVELREVPYSFMWFDMEKATISKMNPVPLPKQPKKPKPSIQDRIEGFF